MSGLPIGIIGIVFMLLFMFSGIPVAFCFFIVGFLGIWLVRGLDVGIAVLSILPYEWARNYHFMAIPLFVLMGYFAYRAGITEELYAGARNWVGHVPGGLAMSTVVACTGFAACSGSSTAGAATMGTIALPEMERYGYDRKLATGCVAAGGTIGSMIPPSLGFIILGIIMEVSISKLFIAGIFPGLLESFSYMAIIFLLVKMKPKLAPLVPAAGWKQRFTSLRGIWGMLALFILVMGGIFLGIFTPTEGGAVGACGAFLIALFRGKLTRANFVGALLDTGKVTCMIFLIFIGAMVFGNFMAFCGVPMALCKWVTSLDIPPIAVFIAIISVYIPFGCIMDVTSVTLLTIPIFLPVLQALNINLIWFAVCKLRTAELAAITPPVGLNVYVLDGVTNVPLEDIFKGVTPFIIMDLINLSILIAFPQISLFIPSLMRRG